MTIPATPIKSAVIDEIDLQKVRRRGVGGSDVAAIVGVHPYKTAHDVWLQKMKLVEFEKTEAMLWGELLEPVVAGEYSRRTNVALLELSKDARFLVHPKRPWMRATVDYLARDIPIGVDPKTAGLRVAHRWGAAGTDDFPEEYVLQMQWYLAVCEDRERWDVPALIGQELRTYVVLPHRDLQTMLIEVCGEWWERYVLTKTPPPVDHSVSASKMLERIFPRNIDAVRQATPAEVDAALTLREITAIVDEAQQELNKHANLVKQAIGEADGVEGPFGKITWKRTKDGTETDWEQAARWMAQHAKVDPAVFEQCRKMFTTPKPGSRRFLPQFRKSA